MIFLSTIFCAVAYCSRFTIRALSCISAVVSCYLFRQPRTTSLLDYASTFHEYFFVNIRLNLKAFSLLKFRVSSELSIEIKTAFFKQHIKGELLSCKNSKNHCTCMFKAYQVRTFEKKLLPQNIYSVKVLLLLQFDPRDIFKVKLSFAPYLNICHQKCLMYVGWEDDKSLVQYLFNLYHCCRMDMAIKSAPMWQQSW